jgi:hypothetical protein
MPVRAVFRRWRWPLLVTVAVALLVCGASFLTLPLEQLDKARAAEHLVAWVVEGRPLPGFGEPYPDARWMPDQKRFFVFCDCVPEGMALSSDPRVHRLAAAEYETVFRRHRWDSTDYLTIELKEASDGSIVLQLSNVFGPLAAHGYRFEFRRTLWGLRARGKLLWVS